MKTAGKSPRSRRAGKGTPKRETLVKRVKIAELKDHLSSYLRSVERGATVEVTDRDRPIAQIVPIPVDIAAEEAPLKIIPARYPFSTIRDKHYPPANWSIDSLDLLLEDRRRR